MLQYLKSLSWWKYLLLIPYVYLVWVILRGLFSANVLLQLQYQDGDTWYLPENVEIPSFIPDYNGYQASLQSSAPSDAAMSGVVWATFFLLLYTILLAFLNRNARHYMNIWVYSIITTLFVVGTFMLFIRMSYTSVIFALSTDTIQYNMLVFPFSMVYFTFLSTGKLTATFAALICVFIPIIRFFVVRDVEYIKMGESAQKQRERIHENYMREKELEREYLYNRNIAGRKRPKRW